MSGLDIFALPVHPAADIFPMLSDEELDDLAADIKANGLLQPFVVAKVEGAWTLVDGRNRREACRRAGVRPGFEDVHDLNGTDPVGYIISANIHRRHMNKGQQAMAVAMIHPEPAKGGRGKNSNLKLGFSEMGLDAAYKQALAIKQAGEKQLERLGRLQRKAPDLHDRVKQRELSYDEAEAIFKDREGEAHRKRDGLYQTFIKAVRAIDAVNGTGNLEELPALLEDVDYYADFRAEAGDVKALIEQAESLEKAAQRLRAVVDAFPRKMGARR